MKPVNLGVLGLGTVGGGVLNVLTRNQEEIVRRAGRDVVVSRASARDLNKARICDTANVALTSDPLAIVTDPDIDIVVELIGGCDTARDLVLTAIEHGKSVVTANKALIALHGNEIFAAASAKGVIVAFEAAVAGGIPIIKAIREGLSGNRIEWLAGIINGTCNYVLTTMRDQGRDFSDVLVEAQALGYAEANPAFDVEGIDAAHKLTILASIAFGVPLQYDKVHVEGITGITRADVDYADQLGYRIKHLGLARDVGSGLELRVHPALVPKRRLLANVDGVMNAVVVNGDAVGPTLYYGAGAGAEPTASAVVADVVDVVRAMTSDPNNRVPHLAFQPEALSDRTILPAGEFRVANYLRLNVADQAGVMADITRILAHHQISIEAILQKEPQAGEATLPVIMLTQKTLERNMDSAIAEIEALSTVTGAITRIRLETLD